jgi:hypothetical protein
MYIVIKTMFNLHSTCIQAIYGKFVWQIEFNLLPKKQKKDRVNKNATAEQF